MSVIQLNDVENKNERTKSLIFSFCTFCVIILVTYLIHFEIKPTLPSDLPPLNSDEVIEEFIIDNVQLEASGGSLLGGSGTPNEQVDDQQMQSSEFLTSNTSDFSIFSGKSNRDNGYNTTNTSSSVNEGDDFFDGQGGNNKYDSQGTSTEGSPGPSKGGGTGGTVDGSGRTRLNDPDLSGITVKTNKNTISLILTINKNGDVTKVELNQSKTTVTDAITINKVKSIVKSQVKYNKVTYDNLARTYLTVTIKQE